MLPGDIKTMVVENNERPAFPLSCPRSVRKLISECWDQDPTVRPSFEVIIERCHDLIKECLSARGL